MEKWEYIRRMYFIEKKTMREIERETGHAWRTIHKAVNSPTKAGFQIKTPRTAPVMGAFKERIVALLDESDQLPRKQRYTAKKIYEILQGEGYKGAESTLRYAISQERKKRKALKVFLPLGFEPGKDAQVDWGEAQFILSGEQVTANLFIMRLNYSRRLFVMAFPSQKLESFLAGHVAAFAFFGGVPERISYDNLKTAVTKILKGKKRQEQRTFLAMRGHYIFDSHFCAPGAGHEKGGVENGVGYVQRQFMSPLPEVTSFAELNQHLLAKCQAEASRQLKGVPATIGVMSQEEQPHLRPLPPYPFEVAKLITATLTPYSQVVVDTNRYSVPVHHGQKQLQVKCFPFTIEIYRLDQTDPLAIHPRCYGQHQDVFDPLHYLPLLEQRPHALDYAQPIRHWRKQWATIYDTLLQKLREQWPEGRGAREFVKILRLHEQHAALLVQEAVENAVALGCFHFDGVQLCLHRLLYPDPLLPPVSLADHPHLQRIGQQKLSLQPYDQLLSEVRA